MRVLKSARHGTGGGCSHPFFRPRPGAGVNFFFGNKASRPSQEQNGRFLPTALPIGGLAVCCGKGAAPPRGPQTVGGGCFKNSSSPPPPLLLSVWWRTP